jgi:hypothetical protein
MKTLEGRHQQLGWAMLALAGIVLLGAINSAVSGFFWVGAIATGFLYAYKKTNQHGLVVPGGILAGIATGILLEGVLPFEGIFLVGFAGGFWLIRLLEPKHHEWAIYPAMIMSAIAALVFVSENAWVVALVLIATGIYLLNRKNSIQTKTVEAAIIAQPSKLERLMEWRAEVAAVNGLPEPEILRSEQLEKLARMTPENVDAMFGVLDAAQIERYGKALLGVLR